MFTVVVTLFVVCWLPYHVYFVYQYIDHNVISYKHVQHIFLAFYWLAMSNTMINPLVYYFMNTRCLRHTTGYYMLYKWSRISFRIFRFRQYFRATMVRCVTCGQKSLPDSAFGNNSAVLMASGNSIRLGHHRSRSNRNGFAGINYWQRKLLCVAAL